MTTYYQIIECTDPNHEAGEIVRRCEATDRRQAMRKFGIAPDCEALYDVVPASQVADNVYDPHGLRL